VCAAPLRRSAAFDRSLCTGRFPALAGYPDVNGARGAACAPAVKHVDNLTLVHAGCRFG
jgi:hypothetical protein